MTAKNRDSVNVRIITMNPCILAQNSYVNIYNSCSYRSLNTTIKSKLQTYLVNYVFKSRTLYLIEKHFNRTYK